MSQVPLFSFCKNSLIRVLLTRHQIAPLKVLRSSALSVRLTPVTLALARGSGRSRAQLEASLGYTVSVRPSKDW